MAVKVFFLLCIEAVFAQTGLCQYIGEGLPGCYGPNWNFDNFPYDGMGVPPYAECCFGPVDNFGFNIHDSPYGVGWDTSCGGLGTVAPGPMFTGGYPQASGSSIPPASFSVLSENYIEGIVSMVGKLPFIASVSMSGEFPSAGAGTVSYGCGDGNVRILGERGMVPPCIPASEYGLMDFTGLYPYGPTFVEEYRGPIPYLGTSYGPAC